MSEYLGTRRTSSKVNPSLNSNWTLERGSNIDYKPVFLWDNFEATTTASFVSKTLWVRIISAPFRTDTTSAAIDPYSRSFGFSFRKSFPIKDLFETEIKIGYFCFIDFKFCITWRSLTNPSDLILVKKEPFPDFLKNPIAGSKTILFEGNPIFFKMSMLCFRRFFVVFWFPDTLLVSN